MLNSINAINARHIETVCLISKLSIRPHIGKRGLYHGEYSVNRLELYVKELPDMIGG